MSAADRTGISRRALWLGYGLSGVVVLWFLVSAGTKLVYQPAWVGQLLAHVGWDARKMPAVGLVELTSAVLYAVPRTTVVGAILLGVYTGGAIGTKARVGDPFYVEAGLLAIVWLALWLRSRTVRSLVPLERDLPPG